MKDNTKVPLFVRNRKKLTEKMLPFSAVAIQSADQMPRNGDQFFPFRQSSDFYYFTGIRQEKSIMVLCPDHPDRSRREMLFILPACKETEVWDGKKLSPEVASRISGISQVFPLNLYDSRLHEVMLHSRHIYLNGVMHYRGPDELLSRDERFARLLLEKYPLHKPEPLAPVISELRLQKEGEELEWIRKACAITSGILHHLLRVIKPGVPEYVIEAEMTRECLVRGAEGHAFLPVVASGDNACVLHYQANRDLCRDGELVLLDFGAEYNLYASDCSRTVPVNGRFTSRQRELYRSVLKIYREAVSLLIPGATLEEVNRELQALWEEEHIRLGLYTGKDLKNQDPARPLYRKYFPHGISHFMGLDVHDPGGRHIVLKEGMVLTCEPGIYIPEEGVGIRLENDLLITPEGNENLMDGTAIEPEEIENLMNKD
ncbi:MAG: aminopeptidase P N-terminal domain-containing protein [Bacteroidales bacterium]